MSNVPKDFPGGSMVKNLPAKAGDMGSIPRWGRSPIEGTSTLSSILAWRIPWAENPNRLYIVHGVTKSQT